MTQATEEDARRIREKYGDLLDETEEEEEPLSDGKRMRESIEQKENPPDLIFHIWTFFSASLFVLLYPLIHIKWNILETGKRYGIEI
jgi:hypothetical protein